MTVEKEKEFVPLFSIDTNVGLHNRRYIGRDGGEEITERIWTVETEPLFPKNLKLEK